MLGFHSPTWCSLQSGKALSEALQFEEEIQAKIIPEAFRDNCESWGNLPRAGPTQSESTRESRVICRIRRPWLFSPLQFLVLLNSVPWCAPQLAESHSPKGRVSCEHWSGPMACELHSQSQAESRALPPRGRKRVLPKAGIRSSPVSWVLLVVLVVFELLSVPAMCLKVGCISRRPHSRQLQIELPIRDVAMQTSRPWKDEGAIFMPKFSQHFYVHRHAGLDRFPWY